MLWQYILRTMKFTIGQLAEVTREPVKTLRDWTDRHLLPSTRGENRYRYYDEDTPRFVSFIRSAQRLGFAIGEIVDIIDLGANGQAPCGEVRSMLSTHLASVRMRIMELEKLERALEARLEWAESNPQPDCDEPGCVYLMQE